MKKEEFYFQCQIVNLLRINGFYCFSVANGGTRHYLEAVNLKKSGLLAGASDLIVVLKNKVVFIEFKTKKGIQRNTQKLFEMNIKSRGHEYLIINDIDQVLDFINKNKENI